MKFDVMGTMSPSDNDLKQIDKIVEENYIANGGPLRFRNLLDYFDADNDILVMAKTKDEQCVGYTYLRVFGENKLYSMQVAVLEEYKNHGIGSAMYGYVKQHSLGYDFFTASVCKTNQRSINFHTKNGLEIIAEQGKDDYFVGMNLEDIQDRVEFCEGDIEEYNSDIVKNGVGSSEDNIKENNRVNDVELSQNNLFTN